ncbi:tetratricopeptide repeat protein [Aurantivibrio plasticivorans]
MLSIKSTRLNTALVLSSVLLLAACSGTPKKVSRDEAPVDLNEGMIADAPAGLDLTAPDQDPYLAQEIDVPGAARSSFVAAKAAIEDQDWVRAEVLLQELTVNYPALSGPFLQLGKVYKAQDKYSDAEVAYQGAIAANAANLAAYNQLALLLREQGRFADAEGYYLQAIQVWPKHAASHKNLGILYDLYLGKWQQALEHFEIYQYLQQPEPDRQVAGWIIDLKRRVPVEP